MQNCFVTREDQLEKDNELKKGQALFLAF